MNSKPPTLKPFTSDRQTAYKWAVWYPQDGKRKRRLFRSKSEASDFLNRKRVEYRNLGSALSGKLTDELQREAVECQERLDAVGASLTDATDAFLEQWEARSRSAPVKELVPQFLDVAKAEGKRERTVQDLRFRLNRFADEFGDRLASDVTGRDVSGWLHAMQSGNQSRNHFRRATQTFFNWCKSLGYVEANPVEGIRPFKVESEGVEVFTPQEMALIIRESGQFGEDILAAVLIGGFAGLRSAEIDRFQWETVKLKRGFIDLSAGVVKTAQRRLVEIREPLRTWIADRFAFATGALREPNFKRRLLAFRRYLEAERGLPWKDNALRHSFASYLLATTGDAGKVAEQLGHTSPGVVYKHYREVVEPETAAEWWALTPSVASGTVVSMTG